MAIIFPFELGDHEMSEVLEPPWKNRRVEGTTWPRSKCETSIHAEHVNVRFIILHWCLLAYCISWKTNRKYINQKYKDHKYLESTWTEQQSFFTIGGVLHIDFSEASDVSYAEQWCLWKWYWWYSSNLIYISPCHLLDKENIINLLWCASYVALV